MHACNASDGAEGQAVPKGAEGWETHQIVHLMLHASIVIVCHVGQIRRVRAPVIERADGQMGRWAMS